MNDFDNPYDNFLPVDGYLIDTPYGQMPLIVRDKRSGKILSASAVGRLIGNYRVYLGMSAYEIKPSNHYVQGDHFWRMDIVNYLMPLINENKVGFMHYGLFKFVNPDDAVLFKMRFG